MASHGKKSKFVQKEHNLPEVQSVESSEIGLKHNTSLSSHGFYDNTPNEKLSISPMPTITIVESTTPRKATAVAELIQVALEKQSNTEVKPDLK